MIVRFEDFLNENIKYSKLTKFTEEEVKELPGGKEIFDFLDTKKCVYVDTNGDEDEFALYQQLILVSESLESDLWKNYKAEQDHVRLQFFEKFPGVGKVVIASRGETEREAMNTDEHMIFLPDTFRPEKFTDSTRHFSSARKYNL